MNPLEGNDDVLEILFSRPSEVSKVQHFSFVKLCKDTNPILDLDSCVGDACWASGKARWAGRVLGT